MINNNEAIAHARALTEFCTDHDYDACLRCVFHKEEDGGQLSPACIFRHKRLDGIEYREIKTWEVVR